MPKSTIAVSLIAVFLLGYLIGTTRGEQSATAGPTPTSGAGMTFLATGEWSDTATIWDVSDGRVTRAVHYARGGKDRPDGAEPLTVKYLVLPDAPVAPKAPPK